MRPAKHSYRARNYINVLPGRTRNTPQRTCIDVHKYGFDKEKDITVTPQSAEATIRKMIREHNDEIEASRNQVVRDSLGHRIKALNVALVGISKLDGKEVADAIAAL